MNSDTTRAPGSTDGIAVGEWRLDPARSSVEFRVHSIYGLVTVKGGFTRYCGTLDLAASPAIKLVIEADSVDTGNAKRDEHLRTADFFDAAEHPQVRFEADAATLGGEGLATQGVLHAAGGEAPLDLTATVRPVGDEFELEAVATVDQRELGMTWSPLGMVRAPAKLLVRGRLVRSGPV
jgi:polyisoprenoid-binding protein YceI